MFDGENFTLMLRGDDEKWEYKVHSSVIFKGALYIGGGSGNETNAYRFIYRIYDPLFITPQSSRYSPGDLITIMATHYNLTRILIPPYNAVFPISVR